MDDFLVENKLLISNHQRIEIVKSQFDAVVYHYRGSEPQWAVEYLHRTVYPFPVFFDHITSIANSGLLGKSGKGGK